MVCDGHRSPWLCCVREAVPSPGCWAVQVDAFQLAVETPSPQVQQRRRHAADTPLGIGLAALGITDALVPDAAACGTEAEADELSGVDADCTGTAALAEPGTTSEAASDTLPSDQGVTSPEPVGAEVSSILGVHASSPEGARAAAAQEGVHGADRQKTSNAAAPDPCDMPATETDLAQAPAAERESPIRLGGAMALGLSRRRSSMVAPAPVAVVESRCITFGCHHPV